MRTNAGNIIGLGIIGMLIVLAFFLTVDVSGPGHAAAAEIPPAQVLLHQNAIKAAQDSNAIHMPKLEEEQRIVNANNATADSSRKIICDNYPEHCTAEFLNPSGDPGVDISRYQQADFQ